MDYPFVPFAEPEAWYGDWKLGHATWCVLNSRMPEEYHSRSSCSCRCHRRTKMAVNPPIIRLEVERMKLGILRTVQEAGIAMDQAIAEAVEAYCTPENVAKVCYDAVKHAVDEVVRDEVTNFYRYGEGRKAVRDLVRQRIDEIEAAEKVPYDQTDHADREGLPRP